MTLFTVHLRHGRGEISVDCNDFDMRSGDLWSRRKTDSCSKEPVLKFEAGTWWGVHPAGTDCQICESRRVALDMLGA